MGDARDVVRSAQVVQVLKLEVCEGLGTEENVARIVTYYYTGSGERLVRIDLWEEEKRKD